jgi:hypothetical protein
MGNAFGGTRPLFKESPRIFVLAVVISFSLHIFWISAIRIIAAPNRTKAVKFSRVSFLGPILERGTMDLSVTPRTRSFIERRYAKTLADKFASSRAESGRDSSRYEKAKTALLQKSETLIPLIDEALSQTKPEPSGLEP